MADAERKRSVTPASGDGVNIRSANTTSFNGDVDVVLFELLELEFSLLEIRPVGVLSALSSTKDGQIHIPLLVVVNHEALGGLWVAHFGNM